MSSSEAQPLPGGAFVVVLLAVTAAGIELGIPRDACRAVFDCGASALIESETEGENA